MDKFEYIINVEPFHVDALNRMGAQGWEFAHRIHPPGTPEHAPSVLIFKRTIRETIPAEVIYAEAPAAPKALKAPKAKQKPESEIIDAE